MDGQNNQCGCNIFGCNCNFADDDICYYGPQSYCYTYNPKKDGEIEACPPGHAKHVCRSNERCSAIAAKDIVSSKSTTIISSNVKISFILI